MTIRFKLIIGTIMPVIVINLILTGAIIFLGMNDNQKSAKKLLASLSSEYANQIDAELETAMDSCRTLAQSFESFQTIPAEWRREILLAQLKSVFDRNPNFIGVSSCWEPDALDGLDKKFADKPYHDHTGRFIPHWSRFDGNYSLTALDDYDQGGTNGWYSGAVASGLETITEPFEYSAGKKTIQLTRMVVPIRNKTGKPVGVVSITTSLQTVKALAGGKTVYKSGFGRLMSGKGIIISHPDPDRVGKPWDENQNKANEEKYFKRLSNGESFTGDEYSESLKKIVMKSFSPIIIGKARNVWIYSMVVPTFEIFQESKNLFRAAMLINIVGILIIILIQVFLSLKITRPVSKISDMMKDISQGEGDLTKRVQINSRDEIGLLASFINDFIEKLKSIVTDLVSINRQSRNIGSSLASLSEESAATIEEITATIESIDEKIGMLKNEINETGLSVKKIHGYFKSVDQLIDSQSASVTESSASIEEMIASINTIQKTTEYEKSSADHLVEIAREGEESMRQTLSSIEEISRSTEMIFELIGVINNVSEQTNLLAMNAAIEAAHAGDAGKGFSVVADEIRKLSESTGSNAKDISKTLNVIVDKIKNTAHLTTETSEKITGLISGINDLSQNMNEMMMGMKEISLGSGQITEALANLVSISEQVKNGSRDVISSIGSLEDSIGKMTNIASENYQGIREISTGMNEVSKAGLELSRLGNENSDNLEVLDGVVGKFKV